MTSSSTDSTDSGADRRRSERKVLHLPVEIEGEIAQGQPAVGPAEIVAASTHGALMKSNYELVLGSTVKIKNPANAVQGEFRVVWTSSIPLEAAWNIGLETDSAPAEMWKPQS